MNESVAFKTHRKMKIAMKHLKDLEEELEDVQETKVDIAIVTEHIRAVQTLLEAAKKPRVDFSSISQRDLDTLGLVQKRLIFRPEGVKQLLKNTNLAVLDEIHGLQNYLADIYDHVNMDCEPTARMILDAVLLSVAKIAPKRKSGFDVVILPEMRLATGDGVQITNPLSKYEVWLTGNVDYGVMQYPIEDDNRERMLGEGNARGRALALAAGRLFLVKAKRQVDPDVGLASHMPEAVGQAVALLEITKRTNVRFCLSNGRSWIFAILEKDKDGNRVHYDSVVRHLSKESIQKRGEESSSSVQEIVELLFEWLQPSEIPHNQLYVLMD